MKIEDDGLKNLSQNYEKSITTDLFDVLVNLRDAGVAEQNENSITTDLLDITMDTHGVEVTEELIHMCQQINEKDLFDVLVELHGTEILKELIYTHGRLKGLKFGKQLGKFDSPNSAIKNINAHIQSYYDIKVDGKTLANEHENGSTKNFRNDNKTNSLNPLHINTQGFIEGALSFMTGMQAIINITDPNENKIHFKEPKKHFFGLF